jgi:photosystem II stability/assembly factor-like uncharacterized protein
LFNTLDPFLKNNWHLINYQHMKKILIMIGLLVFSTILFSQTCISTQEKAGLSKISLGEGNKTFATFPASFSGFRSTMEENKENNKSLENSLFDWSLKFSAPGKVFKDVSFADPLVGYIVTELGSVYKTVDGGENWISVMNLGFPYYWYGVDALSPDTVIISGFNNQGQISEGIVRWTFNGGTTWSPDLILAIPGNGVGWLEKVHFFNQDTGIVFNSFSGGCWYTSDGGKDVSSWAYITINQDLGWFAGNIDAQSTGRVYATGIHFAGSTDFGNSWISKHSADNIFDGGIDFLDSDTLLGWTGGGQISAPVMGWVHHTTDGGQTWGPRLETFPYPVRALRFFNETTGILVGGNLYDEAGGIYSTEDGGITWNLDKSTAAEMFSIDSRAISADSMDIWCVGSTGGGTGFTGKLYKARAANLVTGIRDKDALPRQLSWLGQNVPNPFSLSSEISFIIPVACHATLKVYDVFGMEVLTLIDGIEGPGKRSVTIGPGELGGGLYYYQLRAGDHVETKKFILVK